MSTATLSLHYCRYTDRLTLEVHPGVEIALPSALRSPIWGRWWNSLIDHPHPETLGASPVRSPFQLAEVSPPFTVIQEDNDDHQSCDSQSEDDPDDQDAWASSGAEDWGSAEDWSSASEDSQDPPEAADQPDDDGYASEDLDAPSPVYGMYLCVDYPSWSVDRADLWRTLPACTVRIPFPAEMMSALGSQLSPLRASHNRCSDSSLDGRQLQEDSHLRSCQVSGETEAIYLYLWWCRGEISGARIVVIEDCEGSYSARDCLWSLGEPQHGTQAAMVLRAPVVVMEYSHPATQVTCSHLVLVLKREPTRDSWPTLSQEVGLVSVLTPAGECHYHLRDGHPTSLVIGEGDPPSLEGVYLTVGLRANGWLVDSRPRVCVMESGRPGLGYRRQGRRGRPDIRRFRLADGDPRDQLAPPATVWVREPPAKGCS